eukprot:10831366-Karenia_brevis.AAC.1
MQPMKLIFTLTPILLMYSATTFAMITARCRPFMHAIRMYDAETSTSTDGSRPESLSSSDA